jgi:leader peptidase (prepilin peptidase)/N-methyltransferase
VELLGGLLGWLLFRALVPDIWHLDLAHLAAWVVYFVLFSLLVIGSYVDLRHRILPDQVTSYAVPLGLLGVGVLDLVGFDGFPDTHVRGAVLGCALWGGSAAGLAAFGRLWQGQEVLGWGDVKLAAMLGSFFGPLHTFVVVMWGSILGSVVGLVLLLVYRRRLYYAFGPPLAVGAISYVLFGEPFVQLFFPQWGL